MFFDSRSSSRLVNVNQSLDNVICVVLPADVAVAVVSQFGAKGVSNSLDFNK